MATDARIQQIVNALQNLRGRLEGIGYDARGDALAGYERLLHWKERTVRYLRENVSRAESEHLSTKGRNEASANLHNLREDVRLYDAILLAIVEALEDNPAYVLEDLSPASSELPLERNNEHFAFDVFVSYSSLDQKQADMLYEAITKAGGRVFLSAKNLAPGQDFAEEIRKHLLVSKEIWLLVSPNSLKSEWVLTEWGAAWVLQKSIIPILHRCSPAELPERLKRLQSVDFYEYSNLVKARFKETSERASD